MTLAQVCVDELAFFTWQTTTSCSLVFKEYKLEGFWVVTKPTEMNWIFSLHKSCSISAASKISNLLDILDSNVFFFCFVCFYFYFLGIENYKPIFVSIEMIERSLATVSVETQSLSEHSKFTEMFLMVINVEGQIWKLFLYD